MKIKEFIRELGYAMRDDSLWININGYEIRFDYDDFTRTTTVLLKDYDDKWYHIATLREQGSLIGDEYHKWCDNELKHGETTTFYEFDVIKTLLTNDIEFTVTAEQRLSIILSNSEYVAPLNHIAYWKLVIELIRLQTGRKINLEV